MAGEYETLCREIAANVQNQINGAGYVSGVWGVGGVPGACEVVLVINEHLDDQVDGAISINNAGEITWRPRRNQSHHFQSETDQIMAAADPWRLIEDLLGFAISEKWQALAARLHIQPKITNVSERMNISEIKFEKQS